MSTDFQKHLHIALRHADVGEAVMPIPGIELRVGRDGGPSPCLYQPMACFILQGSKEILVGNTSLSYDTASYLVSGLDLPLTGRIHDEGPSDPYVALAIHLDPILLRELGDAPSVVRDSEPTALAVSINPISGELSDILLRLLSLLDAPEEIPVLAPLLKRELLFRLMRGPQGLLLRQVAKPEGRLARLKLAIDWIRINHDQPLKIEHLADISGMSRATLHRHFKSMTGLSPLQYQKQIRLREARLLLLAGNDNATSVAFAVGYESPSQFSREYTRQFGAPPLRDLRRSNRL